MSTNGIPTRHAGTRFRSRLEARWAAFFDLLGWAWEYEPIDLDGYIPDFVIPWPSPLLVEVKPVFSLEALEEHTSKVEKSGWSYEALIVGATLFGVGNSGEPDMVAGLLSQRSDEDEWCWNQGDLIVCADCGNFSIYHPIMAWYCYRCGAGGKVYLGARSDSLLDFERLFREAGNQTQWRAP